jgi:phosphoribosyl-ATP pyrophosphohydrolase
MDTITHSILNILEQRKSSDSEKSYTKSLFEKGDEAILKKVIEEAGEVLMATKDNDTDKIIYEVADLYFHILVLLSHKNIEISNISTELERRFGTSGIEEKNSRK